MEIEGNEAFVEDVETYDRVLDFYELLKTNQPKMFTDMLNRCILAVNRCSWKALELTQEEVMNRLNYDIKKGKMRSNLKASVVTEESEAIAKKERQVKKHK